MTTYGLRFCVLATAVAYGLMYKMNDGIGTSGGVLIKAADAIFPGHPEWPHNTSQKRTEKEDYDYHRGKNIPYDN